MYRSAWPSPTSLPTPILTLILILVLLPAFSPALRAQDGALRAQDDDLFFDSGGTRIRYLVRGDGEPVVLIHGFSASVEANWQMPGILDGLAEGFKVIALDNRGHGKSDKPHAVEQYGANMARDVVALLDHLEIEKAHVVGYSMGGFITMKLLELAPDRFLSAVVGGAGWSREGDDNSLRLRLAESLQRGEGILPLLEALQPAGRAAPPEQLQMMNQMVISNNDQLALAAAIRGMDELTVSEATLRANQVPTLAIVGDLDPLKAGVDAMQGVMSNLEVRVLEGADHVSAMMSPALLEGIKEFLFALCNCA